MGSRHSAPAASDPSQTEGDAGSARKRIAYWWELLISSPEACRMLPVRFDASKLSSYSVWKVALNLRSICGAPFARWVDACHWGSGHTVSTPNQLDRLPGSVRRRPTYSREFLISVGTSSKACTRLPVGFDVSKLSEFSQLVETGGRGAFGRWRDACSSGSRNAERKSNQLDRHNRQRKEHDGLGGRAFPRIPNYVGPLPSNGKGSGCQLNRRNAGGYQPTLQYKAPPVSQKNAVSINNETFGSFENWNKDRVEEERKRRALFELMRIEQHQSLQEKKKALDSDKENLGDGIISSLRDSAGKRDPPTNSDKQGGLKVSFLSKQDAIKTAPLPPTPTTSPLKQLGFTNGLPQKRLPIQSFNTSHNSEVQLLNTEDMMVSNAPESSISTQRFSGGGQEGANFGDEGLEIHLPEEDALFSVNDILYTQNSDQWSGAEWDRAEGLWAKDEAADINSRFRSLDVSGSHFHDQIDPNNLYHLFETRPDAEFPIRNAGAMFLPSRPSDRNRQAPFDTPKAIHHGPYCQFRQIMKSMQGVRPAPGGPCSGPSTPHQILQHMTVPGSFLPPQGFPICAPHMFYYSTEMAGANSFQMRCCQPGYGETGTMMAGPRGFDRPVQM